MHSFYNYKTVPFDQLGLFWINENQIGNIFDHIYFIMSVTISAYQLTSIQDRGYLLPDVTHLISISIEMMLRVVLKGMVFPGPV